MKKHKLIFIVSLVILSVVAVIVLENHAPYYKESVVGFAVGGYLCYLAISIMIATYRCKIKVSATMVDYGFHQFKGHLSSSPIFIYSYQGKSYRQSCWEALSQRYVLKHYKEGDKYDVYISAKNPTCIKLARRVRLFELALLAIGIFILAASVYSFC